MASSSSSTPSPQPRNKYDVFISFIGEDTLNSLNDQLSAHTSIFGLRLFVVLGICVGAAIVIVLFLISLWFTKRNNNSSNHNSSHNSRDMASSSSSATSSQPRKKYDVFISFRGEDTRPNFTSHLHKALLSKQIDTYIDYRLEKGDEVWPSLEKAIEHSTLFLVILSKTYASSTWCLNELEKILECSKNEGHLVMPVFYGVDPSHIRKQSGSYENAFKQHERRGINKQQLQDWRKALTHAASLSGWPCSGDRNEAELIKEITERVVQTLDDKCLSEDYLQDLIGIRRKMADVESLLNKGSNDDDVRFIGIWGMGGVGKTTLARALFNKFHFAYEGSCFLSSVREKSKKKGIGALKKELILKLLGDKKSDIDIVDDTIPPYAFQRLSRKKVFIVLDDVDDHLDQLENLAKRHCWFGPGSKILVTTRDKQVFAKEVDDIYEVEALNSDEAFQLFSLNAFKKDYGGDSKMRELAEEVTRYAHGNPLALKVLGSFLCGKKQEIWKSQLKKFQKSPFTIINDIIKLSFEGLDYQEKNIFLDIACFFNGYYVKDIVTLLDACDYSTNVGLESLQDKALLDISKGEISMHHLIKEMGRQIVREESMNDPRKRSRLWDSKEIFEILKEKKVGDAIEGIILEAPEQLEEIHFSPHALRSMPNLKFLIFQNDFKKNKLEFSCGVEFLPNKLKLLCWKEYPSKSLPASFKVENLVQIKMQQSKLTKLWDGDQNLVNLTKIDLSGSEDLIELPNFSKAIHLERVDLSCCFKLESVHPSILSLHCLRSLQLGNCEALTCITSNTHLKSLQELDLQYCSGLNKFSVTTENLLTLDISGTAINGEFFSSNNGHRSKIVKLIQYNCESVTSIYNLLDLRTLTSLHAGHCNKLASNLHSLFNETRSLESLSMRYCDELFKVPENISLLSSLARLDLSMANIETLPLSIKYLSNLEELILDGCKRLRFLPELPPSISSLVAKNCLSLETLHLSQSHNYDVLEGDFTFINCMKLDGQSIKEVETKVLLDIKKSIHEYISLQYPGERVPEWFMYRTTQSLVIVDLCSIPEPWDGSFVFCVVISKSPPHDPELPELVETWVGFKLFIDGQNACIDRGGGFMIIDVMQSDHIFLWTHGIYGEAHRKIEEKKRDAQSNNYHPLLQIQFTTSGGDEDVSAEDQYPSYIKECGVCPTSALELQNYIQQIQLV